MRISCANVNTIGCIRVSLSGAADDTASPAEEVDRLVTFLSSSDLKAAIVTIVEEEGRDQEMSLNAAMPAHLLPLHDALESATIPIAAVLDAPTSRAALLIATACPFRFISRDASVEAAEEEAKVYLRSFTQRRPPHVIRSVMQSIRNGDILSVEEALVKETMLFCALSVLSSEGPAS